MLDHYSRRKMADTMLQKVLSTLFTWMMIGYAGLLGMIGVAWTAITHPMTAFKSKKRNGERRYMVTVATENWL